jgi:uncharacterized membrane protein YtjA (UPF0391 family)
MLKWALIFLIIAVVAGIFGFTNVEAASATIAQWLSGIFVVLFLGALIIGLTLGAKLRSLGKFFGDNYAGISGYLPQLSGYDRYQFFTRVHSCVRSYWEYWR